MNISNRPEPGNGSLPSKSLVEAVMDVFASVKFAVTLLVVIIAACVTGTILPQGAQVAAYVEKYPSAANRFELFDKLGLTHVFTARWFIALLCVLAATVMVCSTRRLAMVKRASGFAQRRALGSLLTHLSILLILAGAVVRGVWGEKGWVELRQGQTLTQFQTDYGPKQLPFALRLTNFEIKTDSTAAIENFRSTLALLDGGILLAERIVSVNHPLTFRGYTFYQTSYNPNDWTWTSLAVVRDPGVPLVYAGFFLLIGGLFLIFYLNPWLSRKVNA